MRRNLLDFFEETVTRCPDKVAVMHHEDTMTFAQLRTRARWLGGYLCKVLPNARHQPVAIFLPKSFGVCIGDIGATYSCNFFTNLDVKTPADRIRSILQVLKPVAVITDSKYAKVIEGIEGIDVTVINLETEPWENCTENDSLLAERLELQVDADPYCIINTSGSTGTPKGVLLTHRGFINYVNWAVDTFHFDGSEIMGVMSAIAFDHYAYETSLMMMRGVTLVLLDASLAMFPVRLMEEVQAKKVNYVFWVPTIMVNVANRGLLEKFPLPELKMIWFAGEVFPTRQFNQWRRQYPNATFVNLYGPCEITVDCTYYVVDRDFLDDEPIPIGIPCRNTDVMILNENNQLCTENEVGEICVRSSYIAMGYYNNPQKTAEAFVQNPLNTSYPEIIYRTGDLGYTADDGNIIFRGRSDSLIKHMGNRVELSEIEHIAVNILKIVPNCCVVYNKATQAITMIYEKSASATTAEIKKALAAQMPHYMMPTDFIQMDTLPRNTNGKIDRATLNDMVNKNE